MLPLLVVLACSPGTSPHTPADNAATSTGVDTAVDPPADTSDSTPAADSGDSTDSAPPEETGDSTPPDTDPTGDSDTATSGASVTWLHPDGTLDDVTAELLGGTDGAPLAVTLEAGTWTFTGTGTWFVTLTVTGTEVHLVGLDATLDGGGVAPVLTVSDGADVEVDGLVLQDGSATRVDGYGWRVGGLVDCRESTVLVHDSTLQGGEADIGGAMSGDGCSTTVRTTTLTGNTAQYGGAVGAGSGDWAFVDSEVSGNVAAQLGGAFEGEGIDAAVQFTLTGTTVEGNSAPVGGGFALNASANAVCEAGAVRANTATELGGGVYLNSEESGGPGYAADGCDMGSPETGDDNSPDDIYILDEGASYSGYGAGAVVTCNHVSCG